MKVQAPSDRVLEMYKCIILTLLVIIVSFYVGKSFAGPKSETWLTLQDIRADKTKFLKIPVVYVMDGSIDVSNTVEVDVQNTVDVEVQNTVEVEGSVDCVR